MSTATCVVTLSYSDIAYLANTLNEVLNGFAVADWNEKMAISRAEAEALLQRFNNLYAADAGSNAAREVDLSRQQAQALMSAFKLCKDEFDDAEFPIRIGQDAAHGEGITRVLMSCVR